MSKSSNWKYTQFHLFCYLSTVSISKIEGGSSKASNYVGGDQVGGSWTDKIFTEKIEVKTLPQDQPEGVDDDEWVRGDLSL